MDEGSMQAKIEKWVETTPPMKRSVILLPMVILLSLFLVWYWDWANLSSEKMLGAFIMNVIVFFFIIVPLTFVWKIRNHAKWGIDVILGRDYDAPIIKANALYEISCSAALRCPSSSPNTLRCVASGLWLSWSHPTLSRSYFLMKIWIDQEIILG